MQPKTTRLVYSILRTVSKFFACNRTCRKNGGIFRKYSVIQDIKVLEFTAERINTTTYSNNSNNNNNKNTSFQSSWELETEFVLWPGDFFFFFFALQLVNGWLISSPEYNKTKPLLNYKPWNEIDTLSLRCTKLKLTHNTEMKWLIIHRKWSGQVLLLLTLVSVLSHPEDFTFYGYINQTQESNLVSLPEFIVAETTFTLMWSKNRGKTKTVNTRVEIPTRNERGF